MCPMIHGQSYSTQETTDNLAIRYPRARAGYFNIGLLHTALEGREGHENYAPCTLEQLRSREYHYWALGHIHQREVVSEGSGGYVIFPGNTQGRHIRETGAKGCYLVHVDANYDCTLEFVPLDSVRWCRLEVDCTGVQTPLQLLGRIQEHLTDACRAAQGRLLATRIVLRGSCPLHYDLLAEVRDLRDKFRAIDLDAVERNPWIEQVEVRTRPPRQAEQDEPYADDASAALAGVMARLRADPASLDAMFDLEDLQHLLGQVPAGRGRKLETPASTDPQVRVALLERAHAWLLKQIAKPEKQP
jgi:exonuclease SbcD